MWKNRSRRSAATSGPPIAAARPVTSCGTIQVYVALVPWAKPRSLAGSNGVTQLPSSRRACMPTVFISSGRGSPAGSGATSPGRGATRSTESGATRCWGEVLERSGADGCGDLAAHREDDVEQGDERSDDSGDPGASAERSSAAGEPGQPCGARAEHAGCPGPEHDQSEHRQRPEEDRAHLRLFRRAHQPQGEAHTDDERRRAEQTDADDRLDRALASVRILVCEDDLPDEDRDEPENAYGVHRSDEHRSGRKGD